MKFYVFALVVLVSTTAFAGPSWPSSVSIAMKPDSSVDAQPVQQEVLIESALPDPLDVESKGVNSSSTRGFRIIGSLEIETHEQLAPAIPHRSSTSAVVEPTTFISTPKEREVKKPTVWGFLGTASFFGR